MIELESLNKIFVNAAGNRSMKFIAIETDNEHGTIKNPEELEDTLRYVIGIVSDSMPDDVVLTAVNSVLRYFEFKE